MKYRKSNNVITLPRRPDLHCTCEGTGYMAVRDENGMIVYGRRCNFCPTPDIPIVHGPRCSWPRVTGDSSVEARKLRIQEGSDYYVIFHDEQDRWWVCIGETVTDFLFGCDTEEDAWNALHDLQRGAGVDYVRAKYERTPQPFSPS